MTSEPHRRAIGSLRVVALDAPDMTSWPRSTSSATEAEYSATAPLSDEPKTATYTHA